MLRVLRLSAIVHVLRLREEDVAAFGRISLGLHMFVLRKALIFASPRTTLQLKLGTVSLRAYAEGDRKGKVLDMLKLETRSLHACEVSAVCPPVT